MTHTLRTRWPLALGAVVLLGAGSAGGALLGGSAAAAPATPHCKSAGVRAVRHDVVRAIRQARLKAFSPADAAKVAAPIVAKAERDGTLTAKQADRFRLRMDVRTALAAKRAASGAPLDGAARTAVAKPILDKAVAAGTIERRAEDRILKRLGQDHGQRRGRP